MATATGSRQPRRRNGDQLRREPKARNCQTKEILPPNCKSVQKNKNNSGLQSPFLLTRLVHFQAAIWHNLSPLKLKSYDSAEESMKATIPRCTKKGCPSECITRAGAAPIVFLACFFALII